MELGQSVKTGIRRYIYGRGVHGQQSQGVYVEVKRELMETLGKYPSIKLGNRVARLTILNIEIL